MNEESVKKYTVNEIGFFGVLLQYFSLPMVMPIHRVIPNPNTITAMNYVLGVLIIAALVLKLNIIAAILILLVRFFDQIDGFMARMTQQCSTFGAKFDAFADYFVWLCIIVGLFLSGQELLSFGLLVIYSLDLYLVNLKLEYPSKLQTKSDEQDINLTDALVTQKTTTKDIPITIKAWRFVRLFLQHNDSMAMLILLLLLSPNNLYLWLIWEIMRHGIRMISRIYQAFRS